MNIFYKPQLEREALAYAKCQLGWLQEKVLRKVFPGACIAWKGMYLRELFMHHLVHFHIPASGVDHFHIADYVAQILSVPQRPDLMNLHITLLRQRELALAEVLVHFKGNLQEQEGISFEGLDDSNFAKVMVKILAHYKLNDELQQFLEICTVSVLSCCLLLFFFFRAKWVR